MDCLSFERDITETPICDRESKLSQAFSNQMKLSADICIAVQTLKIISTSLFWPQLLLADTLVMLLVFKHSDYFLFEVKSQSSQ